MGSFPAFWQISKRNIYYRLHLLLVEEGEAFGVNFGVSKLGQNLSGFFWVFDKDLRNNLEDLKGQTGVPIQAAARGARGNLVPRSTFDLFLNGFLWVITY